MKAKVIGKTVEKMVRDALDYGLMALGYATPELCPAMSKTILVDATW